MNYLRELKVFKNTVGGSGFTHKTTPTIFLTDSQKNNPPTASTIRQKRKILILELWGIGDLTFSIPIIEAASRDQEVYLLGMEHAEPLLQPSFPSVQFILFRAPWTVHRGKYKLWEWNWLDFFDLIRRLRKEKFDTVISVRDDPRDQLLMWLSGARDRFGFVFEKRRIFDMGKIFLTRRIKRIQNKQHKVVDWMQIGATLELEGIGRHGPALKHGNYRSRLVDKLFANITKPVICLHIGAKNPLRRWPEHYFANIVARLRFHFNFHLIVIPEPGSAPSHLIEMADSYVTDITLTDLVDLLGRTDLLLCNDSGPAHIAASAGNRPIIPIFGPSSPEWFNPWGENHKVIIRNICKFHPCSDYCRFSEPYCMTKLLPDIVWPEIKNHIRSLLEAGKLPQALLHSRNRGGTSAKNDDPARHPEIQKA